MDNGSTCGGDSETLDGKDSEPGRRLNPLAVGAAVKRAIDVMDSAISTKPAKLARYDNGIKDDQFQPLEDFYHREIQTDDTHLSTSLGNCRILIPPDMLKLDERHTPLDVEAFLSRVETYDLLMWPNKPDRISAFHCARFGWRIAGSNTLVCVSCHRVEVIPQDPPSCMTLSSWTSKIEHRIQKTGHMSGCIWMKSPSPLNILQLPDGRDMQNYMSRASESFKQMKILPVFTDHYRLVMATADFSGLKSKTNMNLPQKVNGATAEMLEDTALFLMMNGWTMEDAFENTIKCQLCLRQTPLWLCSSTPSKLSNQEIESPSCSPRTKAESNIKEFDPISNHWNWCPWRIKLQSVDREEKMDEFLTDDETNMYANEGLTVDPRKKPNIDDYLKMAAKIDNDYKSGRLLSGSALQMSNYNKAIETICNVKELLDSAVRSAKHCIISGRRSDCKATNSPNNTTNGIMSIRLSQNFSRKLFDDSDSASLSDSLQRFPDQIFSVENPVDSNSVNEILLHQNEEFHIQSVRQVCTAGDLESEELESKSCSYENETTVYAKKDEQDGDIKADQIIEKPMQQIIPLECLESNAVTPQPKENSSQCGSPTIEINSIEVPDTLVSCPKLTRLHIKSITKAKESTKLEMDQDTSGSVLGKNVKPYKNCKDKENQLSCDSSAQDDITITRPSSDEVESDNQQEKKRVADEISSNFNEGVGCDDCEKSDIIVANKEIDDFAVPTTIRSKASIIQLDEISSMGDNNDPLCIGKDAVVGQKTQNENIQKRPETFQDTVCTKAETELVSFIENQADAKPQKAFIIENSNIDNENKDDAIGNDAKCTETETAVEISNQETHVASCTENQADPVDTDNRKQTIIENRVESLDDKKTLDDDIPLIAAQSTNNTNTVAPDSQTDESCIDHKTVERTLDGDEVQSKTEAHTDDVSSHADVYGAEVSDDDDDKEKGGNSQSEDEKECDNDASNEEDDDADSEPDEESDDEDLRRREDQEDFQEEEYEDEENESEEGLEDEEEIYSEGEEGQAPQVQNGNVDLEKSGDSSDSDVVWLD